MNTTTKQTTKQTTEKQFKTSKNIRESKLRHYYRNREKILAYHRRMVACKHCGNEMRYSSMSKHKRLHCVVIKQQKNNILRKN